MTISEIIARVRRENSDDGVAKLRNNTYYTALIIAAIGDLQSIMGVLSMRDNSYQFLPMRGADKEITYQEGSTTIPEIDAQLFYYPEEADDNSPSQIFVNKGLRVETDKASGTIQTADFLDDYGMNLIEPDIAFIKIDAEVSGTDANNTLTLDVSLDNRETWLVADYGFDAFDVSGGSTGHIDVSKVPSSHVALKWTLEGSNVIVRNTTLERLYIPKEKLRHYGPDIVELVKLRLIEIRINLAVKNGNYDPIVIAGMQREAEVIRHKYGLGEKAGGDIKAMAGGQALQFMPSSAEENSLLGINGGSSNLLSDNSIVSMQSDGTIRRVS